MKIIAVDPDPGALMRLSAEIRRSTPPGASVECFCDPLYAHQYSFYHPVDVLYAAARMGRLTGLELAKKMRARYPGLRVFILWPNDEFRQEAQRLEADGYLITPVTADTLKKAMEDAEQRGDCPEQGGTFERRDDDLSGERVTQNGLQRKICE